MNHTTTEIVAREGWKYIGVAFLLSLLFLIAELNFLAFISFILFIFNIYLFRNPDREPISFEEGVVTSPIDGIINSIKIEENFNVIKINHSFLDAHILRAPLKMSIDESKRRSGLFLEANSKKAVKLNETYEIFANTKFGKIVIKLVPSRFSRDISFFNRDEFLAGGRFGILMDGFLEIYLPKSIDILAEDGDRLLARNSVIGKFNNKG